MDKLIYLHKLDTPISHEYKFPDGKIKKWETTHEYRCLNENVEKVWHTGSLNEEKLPKMALHLIMKDGTRKDFYNFNFDEDYTIVQNWLTENNY